MSLYGSKFFFKSNGTQFYIKGAAYQRDATNSTSKALYHDSLSDTVACKRDVPILKELGLNAIRVYAIDPTRDHSKCMKLLDDAGIYVISDLSEPATSINRDSPSWDEQHYSRYTQVIDALAGYSNVLGFFAGNEVTNQPNNTNASPFVKAAIRDMKAYIKTQGYRAIPVGYATNDDADIRYQLADYFNCGESDESTDFWGYNIYSWCGRSSFTKSGFDERTKDFANYSRPVFFAEYGCNEVKPRPFTEVAALYGPDMDAVWSGGIVYMYFQEENDYGLVEVHDGETVGKLEDFYNLKDQMTKANPRLLHASEYYPINTQARACPTLGPNWDASPSLPPTPHKTLCQCMLSSLDCVAKGEVKDAQMGNLFAYACGSAGADCSAINSNGSTGVYGPYSMCSSSERLSWAYNAFYLASNKHPTACNFEGTGKRQLNPGSKGECQGLLEEANKGLSITSPSSKDVRGIATSVSLQAHLYVASLMFFFYPLLPALLSILLFDL